MTIGTLAKRGSARRRRRHFEAVEAGHIDVEQYDGDVARQSGCECVGAVAECHGLQAHVRDGFGQQDAAEIFVVGDDRQRSSGGQGVHAEARIVWPTSASMSGACAACSA